MLCAVCAVLVDAMDGWEHIGRRREISTTKQSLAENGYNIIPQPVYTMLYNRPLQMSNGRILFIAGGLYHVVYLCVAFLFFFFFRKEKKNIRKCRQGRRRRRPIQSPHWKKEEKKRQKEIKWNNIISYKYIHTYKNNNKNEEEEEETICVLYAPARQYISRQ